MPPPPGPSIGLAKLTLSFTSVEATTDPATQAVVVTNLGGGTIDWTAASSAAWLSVTPLAATGPATLTVGADITGLDPGVYAAQITVADPAVANSPQVIDVTLTITEATDATPPVASKLNVVNFTLDKSNPNSALPLATFSSAVDALTLTSSNLTLVDTATSTAVPFAVSYDLTARQATLTPTTALSAGTQYTITVTTGVKDVSGGSLDQDDFTAGAQGFTQTFDTTRPSVRLKGHVPMSGIGDVFMAGNFVYVAGRSSGTKGIYIVDATDIANPVIAKIIGSVGVVQDLKVSNNVLYATNEPGGVRIFSVTNPYNPVALTTINDSFVGSAHNVSVQGNLLFVSSNTTGDVEIYNVSTPSSPTHVASVSNSGGNVHDMEASGNTLYAGFLTGGFSIVNITTPSSPSTVVDHSYTGNFTHSAWPSASGNELYTTDEKAGGPLRIWNISTPSSPTQLATYTANANLSIHNAQVDGSLVFISFYQAGLRVVDVSTPSSPVEVGFFDTFPGLDATSGTFNGNWGVHKVGNRIAISDLANGLFLFRFTP